MPERRAANTPHDARRRGPGAPVSVVHLGPDPSTGGGMPAVIRDVLASPLAARYRLEAIGTYRTARRLERLTVFARALARLLVWCLRPGSRIVHVHTAVRGSLYRKAIVVCLSKALRRPVILHVHAGPGDIADFDARLTKLARAGFARTFSLADRVLSVSAAGALEIESRFGARGIEVVPNAAPTVGAITSGTSDSGHEHLLYLGGFADPAKGGHVLLSALPAIVSRRPTVRVTLAGPGDPPLGNDATTEVVGWVDGGRKAALFSACDVFVLPSVSEGLPVALLEAMAYGRAIVASAVGGMPEVLTDGEDAVLVPPGDPGRLAAAIVTLAADPERRTRLGRAARARAARLNQEEVYGRLDAIYRDLASR